MMNKHQRCLPIIISNSHLSKEAEQSRPQCAGDDIGRTVNKEQILFSMAEKSTSFSM